MHTSHFNIQILDMTFVKQFVAKSRNLEQRHKTVSFPGKRVVKQVTRGWLIHILVVVNTQEGK